MCGIIGYISTKENIQDEIIKNLKKLEYRGYDSSGICLQEYNGNFKIQKSLGEINNLENILNYEVKSHCGIAHTRWATHGKVNLQNTHPHTTKDNNWAIVHNGIIENYLELKTELEKNNINFYSDTDTEVIPNLISISKQKTPILKIKETLDKLKGGYAVCILNKDCLNTLFLAKHKNPLYVAKNDFSVLACSDPVCFGDSYNEYYELLDNVICKATLNKLEFFDSNLNKIELKKTKTDVFLKSATKGNFDYFAEKEIHEIPSILQNITETYKNNNYFKKIDKKFLNGIKSIKFIGCGTAYHACLMGAKYIEKSIKIECNSYIASEFRYQNPIINKHTLCIFASQSGETCDTYLSLQLAKKKGAKIISLVNVPYSSIAKQSEIMLPLCAKLEIAVMSTKAYTAMLFVFYLLSLHLKNVLSKEKKDIFLKTKKLLKINPFKNINLLDQYVNEIINCEKVFFIGKDKDYISAMEAGLKLKEITYINCISIASGELKHGTLSLVDKNSICFVIATEQKLLAKNLSSASEIKSRGGKIFLFTNLKIDKSLLKNIDYVYYFEKINEDLSSILSIIPFQLLAYKTALKLNKNPDKPKNLAKSVTVE